MDDIVGKLFEQPEMDEETRILYIVGILGGPTSPYQILPAYNPDADLAWFIFEQMMKAYSEALEKFTDGEYNELQVRAYIYIAERMLANYLTGLPLDVYSPLGGLTTLGAALVVLETGEMILRKIPPTRPSVPTEHDERANYYGFGGAEPPGSRGGTSDDRKWYQKLWDGVVGVANAISNVGRAIGTWVQDKIDVAGEFYFGDSWTKMRETVNFENPYIQAAMFVCDMLLPGGIFGTALGLLGLIGRAFLRVGLGIVKGIGVAARALRAAAWSFGRVIQNSFARSCYNGLSVLRRASIQARAAGMSLRNIGTSLGVIKGRIGGATWSLTKGQWRSLAGSAYRSRVFAKRLIRAITHPYDRKRLPPIQTIDKLARKYSPHGMSSLRAQQEIIRSSVRTNRNVNDDWAWRNFWNNFWDGIDIYMGP